MGSIRDIIKNISPPWLSTGNAEKFLYTPGLVIDAQIQRVLTTTLSKFPLKAIPSALSLLGADRLIDRGNFETDEGYAIRLSQAFTDWHFAGMPRAIIRQIVGWLSPKNPEIKNVDNFDQWFIYEDQTNTTLPPKKIVNTLAWDWDGTTGNTLFRYWTIIFINNIGTAWTASESVWGTAGSTWGDDTESESWGLSVPHTYAIALRKIINNFGSAHSFCQNIIVALDNTKFDETNLSSFPNDGLWGQYSKVISTVYVESREPTARYIAGIQEYANNTDKTRLE